MSPRIGALDEKQSAELRKLWAIPDFGPTGKNHDQRIRQKYLERLSNGWQAPGK